MTLAETRAPSQAVRTPIDLTGPIDLAPAPEALKPTLRARYGLFINGSFTAPARVFPTLNPATEEPLSEVSCAAAADVDAAVRAATDALPAWSATPGLERGKYLYRIARRIQERARELAVLESMDNGKPIRESRDVDVPLAAAHFFYHAGWADKLRYARPGGREPRPLGVCGQIIPWNFPLLMAAWKLAPALACGNTCVLKPAETTPLTALMLAEICQEADLPPGVVNILTGDGDTGEALTRHPGTHKLAFTGSTEVGRAIAQTAAERGVPVTLELGGKSANIIFADAAIDDAIEGIVEGIFFNQGHVCCAGSRLLVEEGIRDEVVGRLIRRMQTLRVGDPLDKNTDVGAINSYEQQARIARAVDAAEAEGCQRHECGVGPLRSPGTDRGYWFKPTVLEGVQPSHPVFREEVFGPVLSVTTFRTPDEAVQLANATRYGLAAGVWTDKGSKVFDVARRLDAGVVWLNTYNKFDPASPFGGFKESGFGREGGVHGLHAYLR